MNPSLVSLGSIRTQVRDRSDVQQNGFFSDSEINQSISQSYKILYDKIVAAFGNDYFVSFYYQFPITNSQYYALPDGTPTFQLDSGIQAPKFYKLLGVDLQYSSSPSGYVTLRRFEEIDRNKYAYPNTAINWSYSNLRYRLSGNFLEFIPIPMAGQTARIKYIPAATPLQWLVPVPTALGVNTITLSDTTGLSQGMYVYGNAVPGIPLTTSSPTTATMIQSLSSTTITLSANALQTSSTSMLAFWNDATNLDGINGWEEFIVLDVCIKNKTKSEEELQAMILQRNEMVAHLEAMAEGRDVGQAQHVSDALGAQAYGYDGYGGSGGWFGTGGGDW